jgi:uncharacterized membrane protein YeaQ/YmgE (transglycosylase-associated protein family)
MIAGLVILAIILLVAYFAIGLAANIAIGLGGLILAVIVWAIIGWLAGQIMSGEGYGTLGNILLGVVGGLVGGLVVNLLNLNIGGGLIANIIVGVVGSIIVIAIGRAIGGRRVA